MRDRATRGVFIDRVSIDAEICSDFIGGHDIRGLVVLFGGRKKW